MTAMKWQRWQNDSSIIISSGKMMAMNKRQWQWQWQNGDEDTCSKMMERKMPATKWWRGRCQPPNSGDDDANGKTMETKMPAAKWWQGWQQLRQQKCDGWQQWQDGQNGLTKLTKKTDNREFLQTQFTSTVHRITAATKAPIAKNCNLQFCWSRLSWTHVEKKTKCNQPLYMIFLPSQCCHK